MMEATSPLGKPGVIHLDPAHKWPINTQVHLQAPSVEVDLYIETWTSRAGGDFRKELWTDRRATGGEHD